MQERLRVFIQGATFTLQQRDGELEELEAFVNGMLDRVEMKFEGEMEVE